MGYLKKISIAVLCGIGNGALFYVVGGVANPIFPAVTPAAMAVIGFATAVGIAMLESEKEEK